MKILVTGCAGFIGWKVAELLLNQHEVCGIDNINDSYDPKIKEWRLKELEKKERFEFKKIDICDFKELSKIGKFDAIINLAARAGVRASLEDPWEYVDTNVKGTLNLLELAKENKVKFILASSSSVYGSSGVPFREEDKIDTPLSPYAATKKSSELLAFVYHHLQGLDISVLRYFTVYGPAGRPDMSVLKFIKYIDEGKPIPVFGNGTQKRDFTYIDDIAEGTILALKNLGYEIINLGNDRPVELRYVIKLIEDCLGKKAEIEFLPRHPADVHSTWADISRAKQILGWEPKVKIEEGIKKTVDWYLENKDWMKEVNM
jgi:nucleoside-diphosphate-sugar epimerase